MALKVYDLGRREEAVDLACMRSELLRHQVRAYLVCATVSYHTYITYLAWYVLHRVVESNINANDFAYNAAASQPAAVAAIYIVGKHNANLMEVKPRSLRT